MMTFYAAAGCYRIQTEDGHKVPYIQRLGKLYPISIPEFAIWSTLLWEVMTYQELKGEYDTLMSAVDGDAPNFDELLALLEKRKLVVKGMGYTGEDALYGMLADAFVVPFRFSGGKKAVSALKLIVQGKMRISDIGVAMRNARLSPNEERVLHLVRQTPLSTAELVRCFEKNIRDVSSTEKVIASIYPEEELDQEHIANEVVLSEQAKVVLEAVSNLYLHRQVILEMP